MDVRLVVVDGPETGRVFSFDGADSFLIGRSPQAHLVLDPRADRYISRTHCLIDIRTPRSIVHDLGSTNGTFVNDDRVERAEVGHGDEIRVGRTRIRVVIGEGSAPGPSPAPPVEEFATRQAVAVPSAQPAPAAADEWAPPQASDEWQPPSDEPAPAAVADTGASDGLDGSSAHQPSAKTVCGRCGGDLGAEVPEPVPADAIYVCRSCLESVSPPADGPARIGRYRIVGELGRGGMGVVYKAIDENDGRMVAVKLLLPEVAQDETAFRQFEREISIQSRMVHPHLVRFLDTGREAGSCYIVSEFLAGGNAARLVGVVFKGPVELRLATRLMVETLAGLAELHRHGVVHRDLKPGNIVLSRRASEGYGVAKITDYGLAKSFEDAGNSLFDLTREGEAAGSLMFMPPEQILNYRFVRPPADVYAAGVSLYYLLTGRYTVDVAVDGVAAGATAAGGASRNPIEALLEDRPVPLRHRRPDLPAALAAVVDRAVQKELSRRFDSAEAFRIGLVEAARHEGVL